MRGRRRSSAADGATGGAEPHPLPIDVVLVPTVLGRVAVHRRGAGPAAVLWHAAWLDSTSWVHVLPALERLRTLYVVDAPGWGASARLRRTPRAAELVRAAEQVVAALAADGADWLGEGEGGRLGLDLAALRPDLVRSVVALAPPDRGPRGFERLRLRALLALVSIAGPVVASRRLTAALLTAEHARDPAVVGVLVDALMQARRGSAARSLAATLLPPLASRARVGVPVLVTDREGRAIPGSRALASLEQPRRLTALVAAFWSETA